MTMGEEGEEGNESLEECGGVGGADSLLSGSKRSAGRTPKSVLWLGGGEQREGGEWKGEV